MNRLIKLLLVAAFLNAISWIILIPIWQYPDEQAHFAQVQDLAELGKSPAQGFDTSYEIALSEKILGTERDGFGNNKFTYHPEYKIDYSNSRYGLHENDIINLPSSTRTELVKNEATHNPPLYYFLGSLFYKAFYNGSLFTRVYAVRILSAFFYLGTIFISYQIGLTIFSKNKILSIILASLIAFLPMFVFSSTGILPDPLTNFLFTLIIFLSLKILIGVKIPYLIGIFLVIILGVLTRQQFLIALSFILMAFVFQLVANLEKAKRVIFSKFSFVVVMMLLLLKDQIYRFLVTSPFRIPESAAFDMNNLFDYQLIFFMKDFIRQTIAQTLPWYWGVYRWLSLSVPHINYQIINRIIIIAIIGVLIKLIVYNKKKETGSTKKIILYLISISLIYFIIFAIWDYFFFISHGFHFGYQGRYFFPLITVHMAILLFGLFQLFELFFKNNAKFLLISLVLLITIFNNQSLLFVARTYYDTFSLSIFINQASQYKPLILKGEIILVILIAAIISQAVFLYSFGKYLIKQKQ